MFPLCWFIDNIVPTDQGTIVPSLASRFSCTGSISTYILPVARIAWIALHRKQKVLKSDQKNYCFKAIHGCSMLIVTDVPAFEIL